MKMSLACAITCAYKKHKRNGDKTRGDNYSGILSSGMSHILQNLYFLSECTLHPKHLIKNWQNHFFMSFLPNFHHHFPPPNHCKIVHKLAKTIPTNVDTMDNGHNLAK